MFQSIFIIRIDCSNVIIGKLTKNRPKMSGCKSWLCLGSSYRAELLEIGRNIDVLKDKLGLVDLK